MNEPRSWTAAFEYAVHVPGQLAHPEPDSHRIDRRNSCQRHGGETVELFVIRWEDTGIVAQPTPERLRIG
jgi:hypothetical protein